MLLKRVLSLTCSFGLTCDPISFTLFALLLAANSNGGGEHEEGYIFLSVSSTALADRLGISVKRMRKSVAFLESNGIMKIEDKRLRGITYMDIVIPCGKILEMPEDIAPKNCELSMSVCNIKMQDTKKKREKTEKPLPQTPSIKERKKIKKERHGEEEKEKKGVETISERRKMFWASLQAFAGRYDSETLQSFYTHWVRRDKVTGMMLYESDSHFEMEIYLLDWHLNRQLFRRGKKGSITAEKERQQQIVRDQEDALRIIRERQRWQAVLNSIPPYFVTRLREKCVDLSSVTATSVFEDLQKQLSERQLTHKDITELKQWEERRTEALSQIKKIKNKS